MNNKELESLFAKVSQLDENKGKAHTQEEWAEIGARKFKKVAGLGLFAFSKIKTLEEMAQLLHETGIVKSVDEGKEIVPHILEDQYNPSLTYNSNTPIFCGELGFKKVIRNGKEDYRVYIFAYGH